MIDKVKKYLGVDYLPMIRKLIMKGKYTLTTTTRQGDDELLITTIFYLDGDAMNVLYLKNGELLIEDYPERLAEHTGTLKKKIATLEVFEEHIRWFTTIVGMLLSFTVQGPHLLHQLGITGVFGLAGYFFSRYFFKAVIWLIKFVARTYTRKFVPVKNASLPDQQTT